MIPRAASFCSLLFWSFVSPVTSLFGHQQQPDFSAMTSSNNMDFLQHMRDHFHLCQLVDSQLEKLSDQVDTNDAPPPYPVRISFGHKVLPLGHSIINTHLFGGEKAQLCLLPALLQNILNNPPPHKDDRGTSKKPPKLISLLTKEDRTSDAYQQLKKCRGTLATRLTNLFQDLFSQPAYTMVADTIGIDADDASLYIFVPFQGLPLQPLDKGFVLLASQSGSAAGNIDINQTNNSQNFGILLGFAQEHKCYLVKKCWIQESSQMEEQNHAIPLSLLLNSPSEPIKTAIVSDIITTLINQTFSCFSTKMIDLWTSLDNLHPYRCAYYYASFLSLCLVDPFIRSPAMLRQFYLKMPNKNRIIVPEQFNRDFWTRQDTVFLQEQLQAINTTMAQKLADCYQVSGYIQNGPEVNSLLSPNTRPKANLINIGIFCHWMPSLATQSIPIFPPIGPEVSVAIELNPDSEDFKVALKTIGQLLEFLKGRKDRSSLIVSLKGTNKTLKAISPVNMLSAMMRDTLGKLLLSYPIVLPHTFDNIPNEVFLDLAQHSVDNHRTTMIYAQTLQEKAAQSKQTEALMEINRIWPDENLSTWATLCMANFCKQNKPFTQTTCFLSHKDPTAAVRNLLRPDAIANAVLKHRRNLTPDRIRFVYDLTTRNNFLFASLQLERSFPTIVNHCYIGTTNTLRFVYDFEQGVSYALTCYPIPTDSSKIIVDNLALAENPH